MSATFDIGTSITWIEDTYCTDCDEYGNLTVEKSYRSGTIKRLTRYTAIVEFVNAQGETVEARFDKYRLADSIEDHELRTIILASIREPEPIKPEDTTPYVIYALGEPATGIARYVGITKNLQRRYRQHCTCSGFNLQKNLWIIELLQKGQQPLLFTIEVVKGREVALEREKVWIHHYLERGLPLTNVIGATVFADGGTRIDNPALTAHIHREITEGRQ